MKIMKSNHTIEVIENSTSRIIVKLVSGEIVCRWRWWWWSWWRRLFSRGWWWNVLLFFDRGWREAISTDRRYWSWIGLCSINGCKVTLIKIVKAIITKPAI